MPTPDEIIEQSLSKLRTAKRFSHTSNSYRKDNPGEYAKVIAYLDGGARPSDVVTDMGLHAVLEEDARRALVGTPPPPPSGALLDEQFNTIDSARWQRKWWWNGDTYFHDSAFASVFRDANVTVSNGIVSLTAKRENTTDFQGRPAAFTTGFLQTNGIQGSVPIGFQFAYGLIEARMKVANAGPGIWSGIWLCNAGYTSSCSREIDILEVVGADPNRAHFNVHWWDINIHSGSSWLAPAPLGNDFHIYAVDWRPSYMAFFIDGVERWRYTGAGIPSDPHYILLSHDVADDGTWAGNVGPSTIFPNSTQIDWVRITQ